MNSLPEGQGVQYELVKAPKAWLNSDKELIHLSTVS